MSLETLVKSMTPEIYQRLLTAVETGKWLDGSELTEQQQESSLQAILLYQSKVLESDQHMTVGATGEVVHKSRQELKQQFSNQENIARFKQHDF